MTELRFYLDENMDPEIAVQLRRHDVDAISVVELDLLGDIDINHLQRAKETGRVLCTHDEDFLRMNAEGIEHAGIAFGRHYDSTPGGWVRALRDLHGRVSAEDVKQQVFFLKVR